MIDRRSALTCAALIAVMLAAAAWRIATLDDWTTLAVHDGAALPSLLLLFFPACSALVAGSLYLNSVRATEDAAKVRPWHKWGKLVSISYCAGMLLLQSVLIAASAKLDMPLHLAAIARALSAVMTIMALLAVNRMPKLPYIERAFGAGLQLGPIYGTRYVRTVSKMLFASMIALIAYSLAVAPSMGWRSTVFIVLLVTAGLTIWSIVWGRHLGRKWSFEQSARHEAN